MVPLWRCVVNQGFLLELFFKLWWDQFQGWKLATSKVKRNFEEQEQEQEQELRRPGKKAWSRSLTSNEKDLPLEGVHKGIGLEHLIFRSRNQRQQSLKSP